MIMQHPKIVALTNFTTDKRTIYQPNPLFIKLMFLCQLNFVRSVPVFYVIPVLVPAEFVLAAIVRLT